MSGAICSSPSDDLAPGRPQTGLERRRVVTLELSQHVFTQDHDVQAVRVAQLLTQLPAGRVPEQPQLATGQLRDKVLRQLG